MPALAIGKQAAASSLQLPGVGSIPLPSLNVLPNVGTSPQIERVSSADTCQGRVKDQDFVVMQYTIRRLDDGSIVDDRYSTKPLTYEVGSFFVPGVDDLIEGACVGSVYRLSWSRSPSLGPEGDAILPPGTPIELELKLVTINYSMQTMPNHTIRCCATVHS